MAKEGDILGADSLNTIEDWFCHKGLQKKNDHLFRIERFGMSNIVEP